MTTVAAYTEDGRFIVSPGTGEPSEFDLARSPVRQLVLSPDGQHALLVAPESLRVVSLQSGQVTAQYPPVPRPAYMTSEPVSHCAVAFGDAFIIGRNGRADSVDVHLKEGTWQHAIDGSCYALCVDGGDVLVSERKGGLWRVAGAQRTAFRQADIGTTAVLLAAGGGRVSAVAHSHEIVTWAKPGEPKTLGALAGVLAVACDADATYLLCADGKLVHADEQRFSLLQEWADPFVAATTLAGEFIAVDQHGQVARISPAGSELIAFLPIDAGRVLAVGAR